MENGETMSLRERHIKYLATILGGDTFTRYVTERTKNLDEDQIALLVKSFPGGDVGDFEKTIDRLFSGRFLNTSPEGAIPWQGIGANS